MKSNVKLLHVEDNFADQRIIKEYLKDSHSVDYEIESVARIDHALSSLKEKPIDVILLDLNLPDSHGLDTYKRIIEAAPKIPIVILSNMKDEALAKQTVEAGAQDYLIKDEVDTKSIEKAIRFAIRRQNIRTQIDKPQSIAASSSNLAKVKDSSLKSKNLTLFQSLINDLSDLLNMNSSDQAYSSKLDKIVNSFNDNKAHCDDLIDLYSVYTANNQSKSVDNDFKVIFELLSHIVVKAYSKVSVVKSLKSKVIEVDLI